MKERAYHEQVNINNEVKLRSLLHELPTFCKEYFIGIEQRTSSRTRIAYAYDLGIFFHYLRNANPYFEKKELAQWRLADLDKITPTDIEEYLSYLKYYEKDGSEFTNDERGMARKLACLRSFYNYFFRKEAIEKNPAALVLMPKQHEKNIVRFDIDEIVHFLDAVEDGDQLTAREKKYHDKTRNRDLAMMTLFLGTGIRVSECVGLNIDDIDFNNNGIKIHRKGGTETVVYFGEEVRTALLSYLEERKQIIPEEGSVDAVFISMQNKRISIRAVENLVKKYSRLVTTLKNITPHKLRSTYGTNLYKETGDIYLVADVLGHKDVNTTKKHYAALEDDRRRKAATAIHLRKE